jgi:hypothetical protein
MPNKNSVYNHKRYWYHVSTTLKRKKLHLIPWDERDGFNRGGIEPPGKRICVAPTIEQCITALPYSFDAEFVIYRTEQRVKPEIPVNVYDSSVTQEGWLLTPTKFIKIGNLKLDDIEKGLEIDNVIEEQAASCGNIKGARKVLRWWKKIKVYRFIKRT